MSDTAHPPAAGMTPGTLFLYLALGGLGLYLFLLFFAMGITTIGQAKQRYPEVLMGFIMLMFAAGAIAYGIAGKRAAGGGGH